MLTIPAGSRDNWTVFRAGSVCSAVLVCASYGLSWVRYDGPTASAAAGGEETIVDLEVADQGTVSAWDIAYIPEFVVALAIVALLVSVVQWTLPGQILTAAAGLLGAGGALFLWSFLGTGGAEELIEIGTLVGPRAAFEPALGLWAALVGSLLVTVCSAFGGAQSYVETLDERESQAGREETH